MTINLLMEGMEGLADGQAHVQNYHLARLRDKLIAGVAVEEGSHFVPRELWLLRLHNRTAFRRGLCSHTSAPEA